MAVVVPAWTSEEITAATALAMLSTDFASGNSWKASAFAFKERMHCSTKKKKPASVTGGGAVHKRSFRKKTARRFRRRDEVAELQYDIQSLCDRDPDMQSLCDRDPEMQRLLRTAKCIAR